MPTAPTASQPAQSQPAPFKLGHGAATHEALPPNKEPSQGTIARDELARHGLPTRAEITDAAIGAEADGLMLHKGPNIAAAVRSQQTIVRRS